MAQDKLIDGKYEYFAFISYKEEDAEWARWLQRKLEHYKLPAVIRKEKPELPERISPIYEYKSEAGGGRLKDVIWKGLTNSKYLIVICSPRAGGNKSQWLNNGIRFFIESGIEENIIPFIVEGKPKTENPDEECFPSALLELKNERELRGININEMGRDAAAVKVVSRMFDVKFDTLWQRYEREQKLARNRKIGMIASVVSAFAIAALIFAFIVSNKNAQLDDQNTQLVNAADRLREDSIALSNHVLRIQNDSVLLSIQKDSIQKTNADLAKANTDLQEANFRIRKERDRMLVSQSKAVSEKAISLIEDGDSYTARQIALFVLPNNLKEPNRPYVSEAEMALRQASLQNSGVFREKGSSSVVFSPTGKLIASAYGSSINIIDTKNGALLRTLYGHKKRITSVAYSPNGKWIASGSEDYTIKIWDTQKGTAIFTLQNEYKHAMDSSAIFVEAVDKVVFSNDGNYLLSTSHMFDHSIKIWDVEKGTLHNTLKADASVREVMYTSDGKQIISVSWQGKISVWDAQTGDKIKDFRVVDVIDCAAISPDGHLLALGSYGIKVFDMQADSVIMNLDGHTKSVSALAFSADGKSLLSASLDYSIRMWDLNSKKQIKLWEGHRWQVNSIAFHPDGNSFVSASSDGDVRLWDLNPYHSKYTFKEHTSAVEMAVFSMDGSKVASASWDKSILIWDSETGRVLRKIEGHTGNVEKLAFSPNGKIIVSSSIDKTIKIWDVGDGSLIKILSSENASVVFNQKGDCMISASNEGTFTIWDTHNWKKKHESKMPRASFQSVSFSPNNKHVVTSIENYATMPISYAIIIWDVETGRIVKRIEESGEIRDVKYSPDGKMIVSTLGYDFALRDAESGELLHVFEGHRDCVTSICFSPDGKWIVSASHDHQIKVWNVSTKALLTTLNEHNSFIETVAFNPNGNEFISASLDHTVKIWDFPDLQRLIDDSHLRFDKRILSHKERCDYFLE